MLCIQPRVFLSLFVSFTCLVLCYAFMWGWNPHFHHFVYRFVVFFGFSIVSIPYQRVAHPFDLILYRRFAYSFVSNHLVVNHLSSRFDIFWHFHWLISSAYTFWFRIVISLVASLAWVIRSWSYSFPTRYIIIALGLSAFRALYFVAVGSLPFCSLYVSLSTIGYILLCNMPFRVSWLVIVCRGSYHRINLITDSSTNVFIIFVLIVRFSLRSPAFVYSKYF